MLQTVPAKPRNQTQKENVIPGDAASGQVDGTHEGYTPGENLNPQTRILQLRKAKFRGGRIALRSSILGSSSNNTSSNSSSDVDGPNDADAAPSPPLDSPSPCDSLDYPGGSHSISPENTNILQEISNSSLRRKRNDGSRSRASPPRPFGIEKRRDRYPSSKGHVSPYAALLADTFVPPDDLETTDNHQSNALSSGPPGTRRKSSRSSRRSTSNVEASRYIEHLESQLAALQTQLQSLTSPSASRAQSAKLRVMNAESKLLRQEVSDWENKFSERVKEYTEQQEVVAGALRAQVRSLEREAQVMQEKLLVLESEVRDKELFASAVETTNQDLERRLEVMSELLATSPNKIDLCPEPPAGRRRSPTRPLSLLIPPSNGGTSVAKAPFGHSRKLVSLDASARPHQLVQSPISPQGKRMSGYFGPSFGHFPRPSLGPGDVSLDEESEFSDSNMTNEAPTSPTHGNLALHRAQTDIEGKARPMRKMRRFHGGATRPRTLILPATSSQSKSNSISAPVTSQPTPIIMAQSPTDSTSSQPATGGNTQMASLSRRRSATWNEDEGSAVRSRRNGSFSVFPKQAPNEPKTPASESPQVSPQMSLSYSGSISTVSSRLSIGLSGGNRNLFEELDFWESKNTPPSSERDFATFENHGTLKNHSQEDDEDAAAAAARNVAAKEGASLNLYDMHPSPGGSPSLSAHYTDLAPAPSDAFILAESEGEKLSVDNGRSAQIDLDVTSSSTSGPSSKPLRIIHTLVTALSRILDDRVSPARTVLNNAWNAVMLSRPMLEFRWWLVKLLIGDLYRKKHLWSKMLGPSGSKSLTTLSLSNSNCCTEPKQYTTTSGLGIRVAHRLQGRTSSNLGLRPRILHLPPLFDYDSTVIDHHLSLPQLIPNTLSDKHGTAVPFSHHDFSEDEEEDLDDDDDNLDQIHLYHTLNAINPPPDHRPPDVNHPQAPPVTWLRFGMTLVFAVGIALRDGPGSLLTSQRRGVVAKHNFIAIKEEAADAGDDDLKQKDTKTNAKDGPYSVHATIKSQGSTVRL